ncbi:MAG TPA: HAD family hydrolase [Chitinophagaceae bacterium]|jgi:TFIIF-interacting CTD phosphatase-like protein|nr:HAD family hydrolase [Chitinophagaceae bacterium]
MPDKPTKLLILDLDETLIHSTESRLAHAEDILFDQYFVYKRPFLDQFLIDISQHYVIGIWSSAGDMYVQTIAEKIKPQEIDYAFVWGRSRCTFKRDMERDFYEYEKKLSKLKSKGYSLESMLIVDDTREKARSNYGNAIYIREFTGNREDVELQHLFTYLVSLKEVPNFRTIEKRGWRQRNHDT